MVGRYGRKGGPEKKKKIHIYLNIPLTPAPPRGHQHWDSVCRIVKVLPAATRTGGAQAGLLDIGGTDAFVESFQVDGWLWRARGVYNANNVLNFLRVTLRHFDDVRQCHAYPLTVIEGSCRHGDTRMFDRLWTPGPRPSSDTV
ncbi:hypothetical protein BC938DRAFT_470850 [Jimgerdemannia flammicorona]|uniref:Uncharacterized protein n=1 Tax=Jimgerdemannia flammicorona TaxID=994334 RepID=A0A433Q9E4_9FUNG|nr:hypothetical protein BC938DRAFT_470850 [Jimgerdemannia flammicorona]